MMTVDLELVGLRKTYPNGATAVEDVALTVERGEFVSLVGPSGCGKTTTLRMIAGFESITAGDVLIRGQRINDVPAERRPTSTIFQNFALFPHMTVRKNIEYGLAARGIKPAERTERSRRIMEKLDLLDIAERKEAGLSGGQRQRVALARGLVVEPQILLLDEPLGALDANLRRSIQNELKLLQRTLGITFIFVTHAQSEALVLSDRIVVMNRGRIEQVSRPVDLYTRPQTPFVARFIGRNTLVAGKLTDTGGLIDTPYGPMRGVVADRLLRTGDAAQIVLPSEALEPHGNGSDQAALQAQYQGNLLQARVMTVEVVAHTRLIRAALPDGREILLDGHVGHGGGEGLVPGHLLLIGLRPEEATIVAAEQA
jgi:putative spermidine/putrescine transport system ATP-binding protein/spermidine/putrescine transport system ATP-binding protein